MKVLTFITISLIIKIASSANCKNPELKCIELCCGIAEFYDELHTLCKAIPEDAKALWHGLLNDNNRTMEFTEYGMCEMAGDPNATIPSCHTPHYYAKPKHIVLERLVNVPCTRKEKISYTYLIYSFIGIFVQPLCLPIMVVYTCWKGIKEKRLTFKLVSCYLVTMTICLLVMLVTLWHDETSTEATVVFMKYAQTLGLFLFDSTCLWLNVIGYQLWSGYRNGNAVDNCISDKRRFICYSIYVWGISAIVASIQLMFLGPSSNSDVSGISQLGIAVYNVVAFLVMSVNICLIRCRVINLTNEVRFKSKLVYIIFRLCLMMGIPRMLITITMTFVKTNRSLVTGSLILEPFVIFIVLVWKPKNIFQCFSVCCWCRKTENISHPSEIVYTNTDITNLPSAAGESGVSRA